MLAFYKYLAHLIALLVVVQAAVAVWAVAEELRYQQAHPGVPADQVPFPLGIQIHGLVGMYVIPVAALVLLVLGLVIRSGRTWAAWVLVAAVVQVALALGGVMVSEYLGLLHGINAFVIVALAEVAARTVGHEAPARERSGRLALPVA